MKKILLIIVLAFSFVLGSAVITDSTPTVIAQDVPGEGLDEAGFMFDLSVITHEDIVGSTRQSWIRRGINYVFERIIGVLAATIGGLSVLVMSYGGFLILSSAGSETQSQKGKTYIKYALIGLVFTLCAYLLVSGVQLLIRSIYA